LRIKTRRPEGGERPHNVAFRPAVSTRDFRSAKADGEAALEGAVHF
jgi:hypothetical protein